MTMRGSRSRVLSAALAVLAGVGLASAVSASAATPTAQVAWQPCASAPGFDCATLRVPLDYDAPDGAQIDLAVIRHPATDPAHRLGSMFFNPGGPGGSGVDSLPVLYPLFPAASRARFDVVSFDPRGVNNSTPLQCFATPQDENALLAQLPQGFPVGQQEEQTWIRVYSQYDRACAQHGGPILTHMSTANVARDMDRLRAAVGDPKLTYYGPSYGSYLGATYANLFPSHIRAIVLDGNVDPHAWNDAGTGQVLSTFLREGSHLGSESALQQMLSLCGQVSTARCPFSAGSAQATREKYDTMLNRLKVKPVVLGGTTITYAFAALVVTSDMYEQNAILGLPSGWRALSTLLQTIWSLTTAPASKPAQAAPAIAVLKALPALVRGGLAPGLAALPEQQTGVFCSESPNPRNPQSYPAQARIADLMAPEGEGSVWTWLAQPCAEWPVTDADRYAGPFDKATPPILVVGVQHDPATPYQASVQMARQLANARLLTLTGGGHAALLNKSDCADGYIGNYLTSGALPPVGTVCDQNAVPF
jgi:pimeloyl-ACP methyl ester carboxylesterase